jgi:hypothetical protein
MVLALLMSAKEIDARLMYDWKYPELFEKAELVVIGKAVMTSDTGETNTLPSIPQNYKFVGVSTEFEIEAVIKGKRPDKLVLHHYRVADTNVVMFTIPTLLTFDPIYRFSYLMFLHKESDGRYAPVSGQTDSGRDSVYRLESSDYFIRVGGEQIYINLARKACVRALEKYLENGKDAFLSAVTLRTEGKAKGLPERIRGVEVYESRSSDVRMSRFIYDDAWEGTVFARLIPLEAEGQPFDIEIGVVAPSSRIEVSEIKVFLHRSGASIMENLLQERSRQKLEP